MPLSNRVTEPVGVPAPGATGEIVTVNVSDCPTMLGFAADDVIVTVVLSLLTANPFVPELPVKLVSPL